MGYQRQYRQVDYLVLFIVIALGVTVGNLFSNWVTAKITLYQIEQATVAFNEELTVYNKAQESRLVENQRTNIAKQQQNIQRQKDKIQTERANSRTGQFLAKSCEEWKATHQRYNNYTAQQEMQKACKQYQQYIDTGVAPKISFR